MKDGFDVDAFIEYHIGDCSCEHGHECQSCTMKRDLKEELEIEYKRRDVKEIEAVVLEMFPKDTFYGSLWDIYRKKIADFAHQTLLEALAECLEVIEKLPPSIHRNMAYKAIRALANTKEGK